jgi:hypothetical protein
MVTTSAQRDPRGIVTPDAFEISDELLGTPLAAPRRRLLAWCVDLLVIGFLTLVTRSFALVLGVIAAIFFVRAGFKRTPVKGSVFGRAMRFSVGCLGVFIAALTAIVWSSCGLDFQGDSNDEDAFEVEAEGSVAGQIIGALTALGIRNAFEDAETIDDAEAAAVQLIEMADEMGIERAELRDFLSGAVPDDADWADEAAALFARLLEEGDAGAVAIAEAAALAAEVEAYTAEEALTAYAGVIAVVPEDSVARVREAALKRRLTELVAQDTLALLAERISDLERSNRRQQRDLERATSGLAEATSGGLFDWLWQFLDELGFGFGWATLYLTISLSAGQGQTVGKRLAGIRVVRLDGEPINWWTAFERAGGYAAGLATGLLGFAQVYWDSNRQAIHDRIVGTVVVRDGAEKVVDWESAL